MQDDCSDISSTFSDPLNPFSPPKSHPNFNYCCHINAGMLSILYFNARSLVLKFDELGLMLVETHQPELCELLKPCWIIIFLTMRFIFQASSYTGLIVILMVVYSCMPSIIS